MILYEKLREAMELKVSKQKFKVVSLFSGAMGLDIGIEKTGRFQLLACIEKVPAFCKTIKANQEAGNLHRDLKVFQGDINDIDPLQVLDSLNLKPGEVDLIVGGPPCQSFSTAGKRRTVQDPRGTLLWQYLRFVEVIRPRFFVLENVRGLLSAALRHRPINMRPEKGGPPLESDEEPGSVVRLFAEDLKKLNVSYHMDCFEVNSVNYGAPQIRERVIFIGNRYNSIVRFPEPTHGQVDANNSPQSTLFQDDGLIPWKTLGEAIGNIRDAGDVILDFSPRKKNFLSKVPPGSNWRSLPEEIQKESMGKAWFAKGGRSGWWRRLSYDLPCPTLITMPNHASTSLCHPVEVRALTLKEYALIQEFPENWIFCGSTQEQYTQVGNAVPVRLGVVTGEVISKELDALAERSWRPYDNKPEDCRIIYLQAHVRTRQWYKKGKIFLWNDGEKNLDSTYPSPKTFVKVKAV